MPECKYCKSKLSSNASLQVHLKSTKKCLKLRNKLLGKPIYNCDICSNDYFTRKSFNCHQTICKKTQQEIYQLLGRFWV